MDKDMQSSLPNYIRTYRRRAFLSQEELAFLLGSSAGTTVVRHEADERVPKLDTALTYAVVLQVDTRELFAGRYEEQAAAVRERAAVLLESVKGQLRTEDVREKTLFLRALVEDPEPHLVPCEE